MNVWFICSAIVHSTAVICIFVYKYVRFGKEGGDLQFECDRDQITHLNCEIHFRHSYSVGALLPRADPLFWGVLGWFYQRVNFGVKYLEYSCEFLSIYVHTHGCKSLTIPVLWLNFLCNALITQKIESKFDSFSQKSIFLENVQNWLS